MTSTDDIEKIYLEYFKETFDTLGLQKYESSNFGEQGRCVKFKNKGFRLQLLDDRGLIETDISPLFGKEQFRGIEMYKSLLTLMDSHNNLSTSERKKILATRLDYKSQATFLTDNFERLGTLLNKANCKTTLKEIENVGQERYNY